MKKIVSLIVTLSLVFLSLPYTSAEAFPDCDYSLSCIGVVISHEYSILQPKYKLSDFSEKLFDEIVPIALYEQTFIKGSKFDKENFCDIIVLNLRNKGKEEVEQAIKTVSQIDFVKAVGKCYYRYFNSVSSFSDPNDTNYSSQYGLEKIEAKRAWMLCDNINTVRVAVIECGISEHIDIAGYSENNPLNHNYTGVGSLNDSSGHGTHVAGIIAADINNNIGVAGTTNNIELVNYKVGISTILNGEFLSYISPTLSSQAITRVATDGIDIVNCSYGATTLDVCEQQAFNNYTGLVVAAAGNYGNDTIVYPAGYSNTHIISVAASDSNDDLYKKSNYGTSYVDILAPGYNIYSTDLNNNYAYHNGTSMAAPFVTGVAAMILKEVPSIGSYTIKAHIMSTVDTIPNMDEFVVSGGRLNAFEALRSALGYKMGDVDFDGSVTSSDVRLIDRCVDELETFTNKQLVLADIDKDGYITSTDISLAFSLVFS